MNPERPERTRTRRTASRSTRRNRETFPGEGTASSSANARLVSRRRRSLSSSSRNSPSTPSMPRVPRRVPRRADHPSLSSRSSRSAFDASPVPRRVAGLSVPAPRASRRRTPRRRSKDAHLCRLARREALGIAILEHAASVKARGLGRRRRGVHGNVHGNVHAAPIAAARAVFRDAEGVVGGEVRRRRRRKRELGFPGQARAQRRRTRRLDGLGHGRRRRAARGQPRTSRGFPGRTRRAAARSAATASAPARRRRRRETRRLQTPLRFSPGGRRGRRLRGRSERPRSRGHGATRRPRAARSTRRGVAREHRPEVVVDGIVRQLVQIRTVFVGQELAVALVVAPDVPLALAHAREVPVGSGPRRARGVSGAGSRGGTRRDVRRHPGRAHGGAEGHRVLGHAPSRGRRVAGPRASPEHGSQARRRVRARAWRGHLLEERVRALPGGGVVRVRGTTASHPSGLAPTRWRFQTPSRPMRASGRRSRRAGHARSPPATPPLTPYLARRNDAQPSAGCAATPDVRGAAVPSEGSGGWNGNKIRQSTEH